MKKSAFVARKKAIEELNIEDFANQKGIDRFEAELLWKQELEKPVKGKSPNPSLNLFKM